MALHLYIPISIKVAPVNHVSYPAVNPFVVGSLVLFTFIEIMETINFVKRHSRELSSQMAAKILKHE